MKREYKVAGFLARAHGLEGLTALINSQDYTPSYVFTHRRKATFEDPKRGFRPEFLEFQKIARNGGIPLLAVDSKKEANRIKDILEREEIDLFAVISWRRLIPADLLRIPRYGGVNLHRGKLPEYAGGEPIKKALKDRQEKIYITGHMLEKGIDTGKVLIEQEHPVNYDYSKSFEENVERLKREITGYYGQMLIQCLDMVVKNERS